MTSDHNSLPAFSFFYVFFCYVLLYLMISSALSSAAVIFGQKFSSPARATNPAFFITFIGCSFTWENTMVTPLLSQVFVSAVRAFIAVLSSAGTALIRSTQALCALFHYNVLNGIRSAKEQRAAYFVNTDLSRKLAQVFINSYSIIICIYPAFCLCLFAHSFDEQQTCKVIPISIATTRSNNTVSTKVTTRTRISLFWSCFY